MSCPKCGGNGLASFADGICSRCADKEVHRLMAGSEEQYQENLRKMSAPVRKIKLFGITIGTIEE